MSLISSDKMYVVVGLGKTGLSAARYLKQQGKNFRIVDSRENVPGLKEAREEFKGICVYAGDLMFAQLSNVDCLIVSPGVSLFDEPAIRNAIEAGVEISSDVDLFCAEVEQPIIAITGSNAKSTVTTLVGEMAQASGTRVAVGGNIGVPVLELLSQKNVEMYVLELSSFQLERCHQLKADVATILNISPDHMDRYYSLAEYAQAKQRIYHGCRVAVVNRNDKLTEPLMANDMTRVSFGLNKPDLKDWGVAQHQGEDYLFNGLQPVMPVSEIALPGRHNLENALSALAIAQAAGLDLPAMLQCLRDFKGLQHRCQLVMNVKGVDYFNDSKATNTGAAVAAIEGLGSSYQQLHIIAGGQGKGADFTPFYQALQKYNCSVTLIGEQAGEMNSVLQGKVDTQLASNMNDAVHCAFAKAKPGDAVLLSPACASFDMFKNFEDRGEKFIEAVHCVEQEMAS